MTLAEREEYHQLMTREEYNALKLIGWHQVCHDFRGEVGATAIRYDAAPPLPDAETIADALTDAAKWLSWCIHEHYAPDNSQEKVALKKVEKALAILCTPRSRAAINVEKRSEESESRAIGTAGPYVILSRDENLPAFVPESFLTPSERESLNDFKSLPEFKKSLPAPPSPETPR